MKNAERLANRVRECRKRAGIRQSDLAEQVGVTRQTIIAIEKERFNPSVALGLRIARVLGESVDALFVLTPFFASEPADSAVEQESAAVLNEEVAPAAAPEPAFEALASLMGPDEENVSNDPVGVLPSPLDGSAQSPIQGVWDF
ncbi:MAG: helix-turn-helix transcriptional regulator [Candidatus Hydrogenedentes bacterium]|nr:helix-turn-helix transcriptional regulator [Candidatus Hydrogenedentota bacterium]